MLTRIMTYSHTSADSQVRAVSYRHADAVRNDCALLDAAGSGGTLAKDTLLGDVRFTERGCFPYRTSHGMGMVPDADRFVNETQTLIAAGT